MRAHDIHMGAAIDEKNRIILLTGCIDRNEHSIVLKIKVPSLGEWTIIKAEVNITDEPWTGWQINIGKGATVATTNGVPDLLMSRHFPKAQFIPEYNAVAFTGGEPVRPGDAILKYTKLDVKRHEVVLSHNRATPTTGIPVLDGTFGRDFPNIEVDVPVTYFDSTAETVGFLTK
jgi:hypothetical protein